jgi:hypothetical protein
MSIGGKGWEDWNMAWDWPDAVTPILCSGILNVRGQYLWEFK